MPAPSPWLWARAKQYPPPLQQSRTPHSLRGSHSLGGQRWRHTPAAPEEMKIACDMNGIVLSGLAARSLSVAAVLNQERFIKVPHVWPACCSSFRPRGAVRKLPWHTSSTHLQQLGSICVAAWILAQAHSLSCLAHMRCQCIHLGGKGLGIER